MKLKKINVRNFIETLTDNELKNVVGGYGTEPWPGTVSGTCGTGGGGDSYCCISREKALEIFVKEGFANWCCDHCSTTDYCGHWTC